MHDDTRAMVNELEERKTRRSAVVWSGMSILGYIWDVIRNVVIVGIVLGIFNAIHDSSSTIIAAIAILIYLSVITIGAQVMQNIVRMNLLLYKRTSEILKKHGEQDAGEQEELENVGFLLEKAQYKFILNSIFSTIIFLITVASLIGAL